MTSPYVSVPQSQQWPTPSPTDQPAAPHRAWPIVRAVLAVLACVGCILLALFAAFWSAITWSGCFLSCDEPNHVGGLLGALLAVALLSCGPLATAGLYRSRTWLWVTAGTAAVGSVLMVGVLGSA